MPFAIVSGGSKVRRRTDGGPINRSFNVQGIGFQLARIIRNQTDLTVLVASRSRDTFEKSLAETSSSSSPVSSSSSIDDRFRHLAMDVTQPESVKKAFETVKQEHGRDMRLFINSAGFLSPEKSLSQLKDHERILKHFNVNVVGPMLLAAHFSQLFPAGKPGAFIESSMVPHFPFPHHHHTRSQRG